MRKVLFPLTLTSLLVGCIANEIDKEPDYNGLFACETGGLAVTNAAVSVDAEATAPEHNGPWTWEELAVRAGLRSDAARVRILDAAGKRLKAERDLQWKSPEVRFGYDWANGDSQKTERLKLPDPFDSGRSNGGDDGFSIGLRFYVPNPFVNHYLHNRAGALDCAGGARAAVEAYAVYSEMKMLCFEAVRAALGLEVASKKVAALEELCKTYGEGLKNGVFNSPLDAIRAETRAMRARASYDRLRVESALLRRKIAFLADVPEEELDISATIPSLPDAKALSADRLTEIAFARRPDLAQAVAELRAADADVGAAKAENIPWFRFVEASYLQGRGWEDSYGKNTRDSEGGFEIKASLYLPIFTWMGKSVSLAESVRNLADARLKTLRASIREEVSFALDDYLRAMNRIDSKASVDFEVEMEKRIRDYASTANARAGEAAKAKQELLEYREGRELADMMKVEALLRLESVIGGPLP